MRALLILLLAVGCYSHAESQTDSVAMQRGWEITTDVGRTLLDIGHDWQQDYIVRLGLGKKFEGFGRWGVIFEYQKLTGKKYQGEIFPTIFEDEYPRHVIGLYAIWTAGGWFRLSLGGLMSYHGDMYYRRTISSNDSSRHVVPAKTETFVNALMGMKTEIELGKEFAIPLAVDFFILPLFYLDEPVDLLMLLLTATPRIGISKRF